MKQIIALIITLLLVSCDKDKPVNNNQYLQNVSFSKEINTNLPQYNSLKFPGNSMVITDAGAGIQGIIIVAAGTNDYRAWEASCPNQYPVACSRLTIEGGYAKCSCENSKYSIYIGSGENGEQYPLKQYRTEILGDVIRVYN